MNTIKTRLALSLCFCFAASAPALASSDIEESCTWWSSDCALSSPPVLDVATDTRDNLYRLLAKAKDQGLSSPDSESHTRDRFGPTVFSPDTTVPPADTPVLPDKLMAQISALGLEPQAVIDATAHQNEEENRFVSRSQETLSGFFAALIAEPALTPEQRHALALARLALHANAEAQAKIEALADVDGTPAQGFRTYLLGANQFYAGDYPAADAQFSALKTHSQPWLAETASYMLMRNALNASTRNARSRYGSFDVAQVDKTQVERAKEAANAYLQRWPDGQYADSTRGMLRRINWYLQDWNALAIEYEQALQHASGDSELRALVAESDNKLISKDIFQDNGYFVSAPDAPLLTFVQTLRLMRSMDCDGRAPCVDEEYINSLKADFARHQRPELWNYLRLRLAFINKDYTTIQRDIAPAKALSAENRLQFSEQVLRVESLMEQKAWQAARDGWKHLNSLSTDREQQRLLQGNLAAALVFNDEVAAVFTADSPITWLRYRSLVLKTKATPPLLRQQAADGAGNEERTIALHTLLIHDLMAGRYSEWLEDKKRIATITPPVIDEAFNDVNLSIFGWAGTDKTHSYYCTSLENTVTRLSKKPEDAHALTCLAEFFHQTRARVDLDRERWANVALDEATRNALPGIPKTLAIYQRVIDDPKAEPEDKSYALYRAIRCYAPSGYNSCSDESVDKAVRKRWFQQLKTRYPGSEWAQDLKYYW